MLVPFQEFAAGNGRDTRFDVCIAGAGVAGITTALELARKSLRVLLLEGGDLDFTEESQELYAGDVIGRDYYELDISRLRYLGGTSNHWSGFCVPLDESDFEARPDIQASGWPIGKGDLAPWLEPAADILEIDGSYPPDPPLEDSGSRLRRVTTHLSPPVRFGEKYADALRASDKVWAVLNASVTDIAIDTASGAVTGFTVVNTNDPAQQLEVTADRFVLALGGIENPRLLLNADGQIERGIGNEHDLVGRYFTEHLEVDLGYALLNGSLTELFDDIMVDDRVGQAVSFSPTRAFQRSAGILNCELRLQAIEKRQTSYVDGWKARIKRMICESEPVLSLIHTVDEGFKHEKCRLAHRRDNTPVDAFDAVIVARAEQAPNPASRVLLTDSRDRLGMRRVALDWQLLDIDKATVRESLLELGRYVAERDIGRIRAADWLIDEASGVAGMAEGERGAGYHHMGTTRMAADASRGVVDRDCKVFGTTNLYIAGSSVFPTGGHAPPTLTIVQLALRLADHLATRA